MAKQDAMTRDIRKRLKDTFARVPKYATGTAKLFMASGKEMFNLDMPIVGAMYETNQDLLKTFVKTLRNPADAINKQFNRALGSESYQELTKFAKYALEDLKSGNLYDESRMRSVGGSVDDMLSEFGGFDMDGFDESGEWDGDDFDDSGSETDVKIAEVQEENATARTGAVIDAIGQSTEATVSTANANAQLNIRSSMKQHAQQMNAMENMITAQIATFELITKTVNAQLDVTREAHQQVMGKMDEITNLLTEIRNGVNPPKEEKKEKETTEIFGANGEMNIANYFKRVMANIDDKFQIKSKLSMSTAGMAPAQLIQMVSDNPLKLITDLILGQVVPKKVRDKMEETNQNLASFGPALLQKIFTAGKKYQFGDEENGGLKGLLASLFGVSERSKSSIDIAYKNPLAAVQFNAKTARAVEEVIPMWLSMIYTTLSGEPLRIYNYSSGKLERVRDVIASNTRNAKDLVGGMGDTRFEIDSRIDNFKFKNSDDKEDFTDFMHKFLQRAAEDGTFIDPHMSMEQFGDIFSSLSSGLRNVHNKEQYYALTTAIIQSLPDKVRLGMAKDIAGARASRNRNNDSLNQRLRDSGLGAAFSGFENEVIQREVERLATARSRLLSGKDLDSELDVTFEKQRLPKLGYAATNSLLTDILATLRKGIITYSYGMGKIKDGALDDVVKSVRNAADDQQKLDAKVKKAKEDEKDRKEKQRKDEEEKFNQKLHDPNRTPEDLLVTDDITQSTAQIIQHLANVRHTPKDESGNKQSEEHRKWFENVKSRITGELSAAGESTGATGMVQKIQKLLDRPFSLFTKGLEFVDSMMYKIIFGEDAAPDTNPEDEPHLFGVLTKSLQIHFMNAKKWFMDEILHPLKDFLFDKEKGLFPKIVNTLKDSVKNLLGITDDKNPIKDKFNEVKEKIIGKKIEEKDADGNVISKRYEGGKFSDKINRIRDTFGARKEETKAGVTDALSKFLYGDYASTKGVSTYMDLDENDNVISREAYGGVIGGLKKGLHDFKTFMLGDDYEDTDSKAKWANVKGEINKALPDMAIGAGAGLLASFVLPGGPILGALVGTTAGLIKGSDQFREFLFGKTSVEEEIDPVTGKTRKKKTAEGGIISKDIYEGVAKFMPGVGVGAIAGAVAGGLGLLPFGMGSVAGTVIGGVAGMLAKSDQVRELIFGKDGDDDSGFLSKNFRSKVVDAVKKYAPATLGLGAAGGALGSMLGAGLGLIPGMAVLPTGPIFGIMGALMGFANADKINNFFFGEMVEEETEEDDGKGGKKKVKKKARKGGMFGRIHDFVRDKMLTPFGDKINEVGGKIQNWFHDSIVTPLNNSMKPFKEQIGNAGKRIGESLKNIGTKITESFFKVFNISINGDDGEGGLKAWFHDKVLKRLDALANKIFSTIGKILGNIISAPFKAFEFIVTGGVRKNIEDDLDGEEGEDGTPKPKSFRERLRGFSRNHQIKKAVNSFTRAKNRFKRMFGFKDVPSEDDNLDNSDESGSNSNDADTNGNEANGNRNESQGNRNDSNVPGDITDPNNLKENAQRVVNESQDNKSNKVKNAKGKVKLRPVDSDDNKSASKDETEDDAKSDSGEAKGSADITDKTKPKEAKGEKETREKTTRKIGTKTNNEYLKEIAKSTKGIHEEIKGQVNGVGWNTAYIKAILDKQFGALSSDELPEEMEGSTAGRLIRKRRTIFGRIKDKAADMFGTAKDAVTGVVQKAIDVVTTPFRLLGKAATAAFEGVKKFGGGLLQGLKAIGKGTVEFVKFTGSVLKELTVGLAKGIGGILAGAGKLVYNAAGGLGSAIGNLARTITGVLGDAVLGLSSVVVGLVETAAAIAPDIAMGAWKGMKFVGKTLWKGIKGLAGGGLKLLKGGAKGVRWVFRKITGKDKKDDNEAEGSSDGSTPSGGFVLNGGYLDSVTTIKDELPVAVGGAEGRVPFPVVAMAKGKPIGLFGLKHAIPVYVVGIDDGVKRLSDKLKSPKLVPIDSDPNKDNQADDEDKAEDVNPDENENEANGSGSNSNPDQASPASLASRIRSRFKAWKRKYMSVDRKAESSPNPGEEYDRAISSAQNENEANAILTAQQMNANGEVINAGTVGNSEEQSETFLDKILGLVGGSIMPAISKAIGVAVPVVAEGASVAAIGYNLFGEKGNKLFGAESTAFNALKIGKAVAGSADDMAKCTTIQKAIAKVIKALTTNETIVKMCGILKNKLGTVASKLIKKLGGEVLESAMKSGASAISAGIKQILGFVSAGTLLVAFAVADFIAGFGNAKNYFNVYGADVTLGMRVTSGIVNTLGGLMSAIPIAGPFLAVAVAVFEDEIVQLVYSCFSDADTLNELKTSQEKLQAATDQYNLENGTELTVDEYSDQFNEDGSKHFSFKDGVNAVLKGMVESTTTGKAMSAAKDVWDKATDGIDYPEQLNSIGRAIASAGIGGGTLANLQNTWSALFGSNDLEFGNGPGDMTTYKNPLLSALSNIQPPAFEQPKVDVPSSKAAMNVDSREIGIGIGESFINMATSIYGEDNSVTIFTLIGEGIGNVLSENYTLTKQDKDSVPDTRYLSTALGASTLAGSSSNNFLSTLWSGVRNLMPWNWGTGPKDDACDIPDSWGKGKVTPMSQSASKWNKTSDTMAKTGCGPTAAAMVASAYGDKSATPGEANKMSYGLGMRASDGGTNPAFFKQYASSHGYGMGEGPVNSATISSNLKKNQPVVVMGKGGAFGDNMHYMVADRSAGKNSVGLVDPASGNRKTTSLKNLVSNTKSAIYSYGKGPGDTEAESESAGTETVNGKVSTAEAQQLLVNKMQWLSEHPIPYSLTGPNDPDKGSASCASTVAWAYKKVFGDAASGMSASSQYQSQDSRFTTIWGNPKNHDTVPGKMLDFSIMQPGDIIYMKNPCSNHTEMYVGNGMSYSHGGPDAGPVLHEMNTTRQNRTWAVNRYTPFLEGKTVDVKEGELVDMSAGTAAAAAAGGAASASALSNLFTPDTANGFTAGGLLTAFLGMGDVIGKGISNVFTTLLGGQVDETTNADGSSEDKASYANATLKSSKVFNFGDYTGTAMSPTESKTAIWNWLHEQGYNDVGAAGIMGCWENESNNRANRVEGDTMKSFPGYETVMANNDSLNAWTLDKLFPAYENQGKSINKAAYKGEDGNYYPGLGLAQWTGPRGYKLLEYATEQGLDWRDLRTQLKYALTEMDARKLKTYMDSATDPAEAALVALDKYEMYDGFGAKNPSFLNPRVASAKDIYATYAGTYDPSVPAFQEDAANAAGEAEAVASGNSNRVDELAKWGTGPSLTLQSLNDKVRQMNDLFTSVREETSSETTVAKVTNQLTEAISNAGGLGSSSDAEKMMQVMAQSLATMVDLLSAIKENTTPQKSTSTSSKSSASKLPVAKAQAFDDDSGVGANSRDIGASIVDILTSK